MRLKVLKIHNIASIEDATIDFTGKILANRDLFLICGPTGSGKTTILDAICLALFNKTPRMESSSKKEVINTFAEKDVANRLQDTMHLVRKNAVEASVTLTFEADGHDYTASWHASRSGQYRKGKETSTFAKLSLAEKVAKKLDCEWMLVDDEGHEYKKDVAYEIARVIKMNFDQFCKTTMLAQGDFTRFLSSSSDEKAQILEKLVGTEQYAEVGRVINRTANDKKNEVDVLSKELDSFLFLSDEEKSEKQTKIEVLADQIKALTARKTINDKKVQWIADRARANEDETIAKANLEAAEQKLGSEDVKQKQQTVALWDMTADVREAMSTKRKCESLAVSYREKADSLAHEYDRATAALRHHDEKRRKLIDANESLNTVIADQKAFEEMFDNVGIICSMHDRIEANRRFISDNTPKLQSSDESMTALNASLSTLNEQKLAANAEIDQIDQDAKAKNEILKSYGVDTIDEEIATLNRHKTQLLHIENALTMLDNARTDLATRQEAVKTAKTELGQLAEAVTKSSEEAEVAARTARESKAIYDKSYVSLDDHAKALRAKLSEGDDCPVCGRKIEHLLDEAKLKAALKPLEEKCQVDENHAKECAAAQARANALLSAGEKTYAKATDEERKARANLEKCNKALADNCVAMGIDVNDDIKDSITKLRRAYAEKETEIGKRQTAIKEIRQELQANNDKAATVRKNRIAALDNHIADTQKAIDTINRNKAQTAGAIEKAYSAIETDNAGIGALVNPDWKPQNPDQFFDELKAAAIHHSDNKKAYADNEAVINDLTRELDLITTYKENIDTLFPQWTNRELLPIQEIPGTVNQWTEIRTQAKMLAAAVCDTTEKQQASIALISAFNADRPEIDIAEVEKLLDLSANAIMAMRNELSEVTESVSKAKALFDEATKRKAEFAQSPLDEGETAETLVALSEEIIAESNICSEMRGRLQKELETDEENRKMQGRKKAELDIKRAEYAEWEKLNRYLGNTDGKNFRNVAQSFILADLLNKANAYLANISTRYTLFCHPGTLTIMMRDAYQGGIARPTNTLSGGESFIISLALALGLSSMQNVDFEVDTLFIDEGFGTLSPEFLDPVISALKRLNETYGRRVGIISHVDTLKHRINASIELTRHGSSTSRIEVKLN